MSPSPGTRWGQGQAGPERTPLLAAAHGLSKAGPATSVSLAQPAVTSPSAHTSRRVLLGTEPTCAGPGPVVLRGPGAPDPSAAGRAVPPHGGASRGGAWAGTPLPVWARGGMRPRAVSCRSRGWWEGEAGSGPTLGLAHQDEGHLWPGQQTMASLGAGPSAHGHKGQVCPSPRPAQLPEPLGERQGP